MQTYRKPSFEKAGIKGDFIQDNHSATLHIEELRPRLPCAK
ncbi:dTDP-4-dehydrorhamnose 3,5-epimerase [Pyrococcus sp. NA2]|nr:dTDP-4-dehydrorhamnose 3,5-epimerase [Pyrococcus sp. NA2]